jgi:hypothetical protein
MVKDINITSETTKETKVGLKHEVLDGKVKYGFFHNKSEKSGGGETRAYQQWKQFELGAGVKVRAEIKEEPGKWKNPQGEEIPVINRTILWFEGDENNVPYQTKAADPGWRVAPTKAEAFDKRLKALEDAVFGTEKAVDETGIDPEALPF